MTKTKVARIRAEPDRRPVELRGRVSPEVAVKLFEIEASGVEIELVDGRRLLAFPSKKIRIWDVHWLQKNFHEVVDYLLDDEKRPQ